LLTWCDEVKRLQNWANADYPQDAKKAREFGAQGIGLCRTERMFRGDRLPLVQRLILADSPEERAELCKKLAEMQKGDFKEILKVMDGLPVIIRLLDPPLHEFLPPYETLLKEVLELRFKGGSQAELEEKERLLRRVEAMREANPMIGLRGVRLGILRPEIYEIQVRAIIEAACELKREGWNPVVEIMIPNVGHVNELKEMRKLVDRVADGGHEKIWNKGKLQVRHHDRTTKGLPDS
jgi:pyruvate,orthophosphate dikinase